MESMRKWHPELLRIVILVDQVDGYFDPAEEDFDLILSTELNLPNSGWFHFKYTILELSTAVKPYAFEFLYHRFGLDRILYLDPDIKIYNRLDCVLHSLERCSIVLTPHLTDALDDGHRPGELDILRSGTYNLGFIGISKTEQSVRFLTWWQARLYDHCVVDLERGLFVDQRWIDLAPGLFLGVVINRQPGLNVAYWNLLHREVLKCEHGFTVNGEPLYFFHFSGFDAENPMEFSKHQNRFRLSDLGDAAFLVAEYGEELIAKGYVQCKQWPYAYGQFDNGFPIPDLGRPVHHEAPRLLDEVANPFSEEGFRAFLEVWNRPFDERGEDQAGVTRLAYRIYRSRIDVQAAMPDVMGPDRVRFLEWMLSSGKREHRLNEVFLAPVWNALEAARRSSAEAAKRRGGELARGASGVGRFRAGVLQTPWKDLDKQKQNALIETDPGAGSIRLTGLTRAIYDSRPDLQKCYPTMAGETGIGFLIWVLTYGKREYGLPESSLDPLRKQWAPCLAALKGGRGRQRLLLTATKLSVVVRELAAVAQLKLSQVKAKWFLRKYSTHQYVQVERTAPVASPRQVAFALPAGAPLAINLVGYVRSEMGIGEAARLTALAARSAGIRVNVRSVDEDGPYRRQDHRAGPESELSDAHFSVFHVNADQTPNVFSRLKPHEHAGRYNIGYWNWELREFPDRWAPSFTYLQEVWTSSGFCQGAMAAKAPVPVIRIPYAVKVDQISPLSRADFGLKEDEFVFLAFTDMLSVYKRKNPAGAAEAFIRQFGESRGHRLVIKVNHGDERPEQLERLKELCAGYQISILDRTIARDEVNSLIHHCDCVLSLHRSEGFGLTLAEAMYLGKPVIATAYSGNMDFTNPDNSFLVDFKLRPVGLGCEPYDPDQLWAEPDLESACAQMRVVASDPVLRARKAASGMEYVRQFLSPEVVGAQMRRRLELIAESGARSGNR